MPLRSWIPLSFLLLAAACSSYGSARPLEAKTGALALFIAPFVAIAFIWMALMGNG